MKKGVIAILATVLGGTLGIVAMSAKTAQEVAKKQKLSDKHLCMFKMMNQWVRIKQEGHDLTEFFERNGYTKVAIYGMNYVGERLLEELKNTEVKVICGIDKKAQSVYSEVDVITKDDVIPEVDVIVVTAIAFFDEIEQDLTQKVTCPIISLEDIIYEM